MSVDTHGKRGVVSHPIDAAVLADYWAAALSSVDEDAVEEHLFDCDECGSRLREMVALAEGVRRLAREGALRMIVSDAFLDQVKTEGLHVREYAPPQGGSVQCTVTAEDDFLIARLSANLVLASRIDLCLCDQHGAEQVRLRDIPVGSAGGNVIYQESITFAKDLPTTTLIARLVAVDDVGSESLLGEYTFIHTRSLPASGTVEPI